MATITLTVTPGITLTAGTAYGVDSINLLGTPSVTMTDAQQADLTESVQDALGAGGAGPNWFRDPDLSQWTRTVGPVSCATGSKTYAADYWWTRPTGGGVVTYEREADSTNDGYLYNTLLTYSSGTVSAVEWGQDVPARVAAALAAGFCITMQIKNSTGDTITPTVKIYTANARDDFSAVTLRETIAAVDINGAAVTIANAATATVYFISTPTSYKAHLKNGCEIAFYNTNVTGASDALRIFSLPKLEPGTTPTDRVQERDASTEDTTEPTTFEEPMLLNGDFAPDQWDATSVSPTTTDMQTARGWYVRTAAGTLTSAARNTSLPGSGTPTEQIRATLRLTGAGGVSEVVVSTRVPAAVTSAARESLAFSCYIYNNTGAAMTPTLYVKTCDASDDYSATTTQVSQALQECADGAWTRVSHVFDASAAAAFANGFIVEIQIPSGSMVAADVIDFAAMDLRRGIEVPDLEVPVRVNPPAALATWRDLAINRASATTIDATIGEIILTADDGTQRLYRNVSISGSSLTLSSSTTNYLWAWGNDSGGVSIVASTSATAPTAQDGYRYKGRISALVSSGTNLPTLFHQRDRLITRSSGGPVSGVLSTSSFASTISFSAEIPVTAIEMTLTVGTTSANGLRVAIAASSAGAGATYINQDHSATTFAGYRAAQQVTMPLLTAATLYAHDVSGSATVSFSTSSYRIA